MIINILWVINNVSVDNFFIEVYKKQRVFNQQIWTEKYGVNEQIFEKNNLILSIFSFFVG